MSASPRSTETATLIREEEQYDDKVAQITQMEQVTALMDAFMTDISGQTIVPTQRVLDLCLDVRLIATS